MKYSILLHPKSNDFLNNTNSNLKERIKSKLKELNLNPEKGKKLKYSDFWRIRIGEYRAIYEINKSDKQVIILYIGHRKKVYDDFSRLL
jgi:mRNA interferase RelE/StbE